ncbi:MAG: contractile injection system tape measure protein, partial [Pseudomonadota bacterium]
TYGTIHTLLHTLIASAPEVPAEANTTYQKLHRRLTANQPAPEQQDLRALLEELATRHPAQLQRIVQDLRKERYDLKAAQLNTAELRTLVETLLKTASSITDANRPTFLQAIETQAGRVSDPQTYYRRLLEDLLQDREIDLEAIAAQAAHRTVAENGIGNEAGAREERVAGITGLSGAAESTDTQRPAGPAASPTSRPQTEHEAIYLRILAALRKAKLIAAGDPATDLPEGMQIAELKHQLHRILRSKEMRVRLTGKLAQRILLDITFLLAPQAAALIEQLLAQAEKLYRQPDTLRRGTRAHWEQRLWTASLIHLLAQADRTLDPAAYIRTLDPAAYIRALAQGVSAEADLPKTLRAWYEALDQSATYGTIHTLLHTLIASAPELDRIARDDVGSARLAEKMEELSFIDLDGLLDQMQSTNVSEEIYINNAGQVLAAPYLPRLFTMLKLVEDDGAFVDRRAAERAVHLLQYMVNEQTQSPEYQLILNKILCGLSTGIPICREIDISEHEQQTIEDLIRGMIQNWKTIGNTSINGLRETF